MGQMSSATNLRFLRPYLQKDIPAVKKAVYLRFFSTTRSCRATYKVQNLASMGKALNKSQFKGDVEERMAELKAAGALEWPRIKRDMHAMTTRDYTAKYADKLKASETRNSEYVTLRGMRGSALSKKGDWC